MNLQYGRAEDIVVSKHRDELTAELAILQLQAKPEDSPDDVMKGIEEVTVKMESVLPTKTINRLKHTAFLQMIQSNVPV